MNMNSKLKSTVITLNAILCIFAVVMIITKPEAHVLINLNITTVMSLPLIVLCVLTGVYVYQRKLGETKRYKAMLFALTVMGANYFILSEPVRYGIPLLIHNTLTKTPTEQVNTIAWKSSEFHMSELGRFTNRCNGRIYLQEYSSFLGSICNFLERGDWAKLNVNQEITLIGLESSIGFTYQDYRI